MTAGDSLADRAARARARSEQLRESTARRSRAKQWAREQIASVRGTATSDDGLVAAAVDSDGTLLGLDLAPRTRGADPEGLARVITAVVRRAVADAHSRVHDVYEVLHNEGVLAEIPLDRPRPDNEHLSVPVSQSPDTSMRPAPRRHSPVVDDDGPPSSWLRRAT